MLSKQIKEKANALVAEMISSGKEEAKIPDSPLTVIKKELYSKGTDVPLAVMGDYMVVQRGV